MANSKKQEIVRGAVELVGKAELAEQLGIPAWVIDAWLTGDAEMPDSKLMDLASFLLKTSRAR